MIALSAQDWMALWLSLKLSATTTIILIMLCIPIAYKMATAKAWLQHLLDLCATLPLVLPPTVIGFYLLIAFSPNTWLGIQFEQLFGHGFAFSFKGLLFASILYSLPFVLQPLRQACLQLIHTLNQETLCFRPKSWFLILFILIPRLKKYLISVSCLCFAHTLGEFGIILMIGGNIPGETQVVSVALYDHVENLAYTQAHTIAALLLVISILLLIPIQYFAYPYQQPKSKPTDVQTELSNQ